MNKHTNHRDYICERDMEYYRPRHGQGLFFGKFSIRNSTYHLVRSLLETWIDRCGLKRVEGRYLYPDSVSEKCRSIITRILEPINKALLVQGRYPVYKEINTSVMTGRLIRALDRLDEAMYEWDLECIDVELANALQQPDWMSD